MTKAMIQKEIDRLADALPKQGNGGSAYITTIKAIKDLIELKTMISE